MLLRVSLALATLLAVLPTAPPPGTIGDRDLDRLLPPPELLLGHAEGLELTEAQRALIETTLADGAREAARLDGRRDEASRAVTDALEGATIDEDRVVRAAESLLEAEARRRLLVVRARARMHASLDARQRAEAIRTAEDELAAREELRALVASIQDRASSLSTAQQRDRRLEPRLRDLQPLADAWRFRDALERAREIAADVDR
ncbi:MAG: Spy/CpxP family protein refolding chaperone [Planctomycetota bacterium]